MKYYQIRISDPAETDYSYFQLRFLANNKDQAKIIGLNLYKEYLILQNDTDLLFNLEEAKDHIKVEQVHRIDQPE